MEQQAMGSLSKRVLLGFRVQRILLATPASTDAELLFHQVLVVSMRGSVPLNVYGPNSEKYPVGPLSLRFMAVEIEGFLEISSYLG
jgi:hypothetical protein